MSVGYRSVYTTYSKYPDGPSDDEDGDEDEDEDECERRKMMTITSKYVLVPGRTPNAMHIKRNVRERDVREGETWGRE